MLDVRVATTAELGFVQALAAAAPDILATVPSADRAPLARLRDELHWPAEDLDPDPSAAAGPGLNRLRRDLFREGDAAPAAAHPGTSVEIFSAPVEGRECVEIARRVLARAREGIPFDRMAVLLRSPEDYRANLEEAFGRAGIRVYFARGARRPDPAGRAFFALLKCAAERLSARRFAEYLPLGQVPDSTAEGAPPAAASRGDRWVEPDTEAATEETDQQEDTDAGPDREEAKGEEGPVRAGAGTPSRSG